ncbi:MAG: HupE/UreJ family protein [Ketobacter sp.]|nr:MAG: HupE/UreJ family protein [Ketobacter sp.]
MPGRCLWLLLLLAWGVPALAHEVRPAYLELKESGSGVFDVLWKKPGRGEMQLAIEPALPADAQPLTPVITRLSPNAAIQTWQVIAPDLRGQRIGIDGLNNTLTDALVRIQFADGSHWVTRLTPSAPSAQIPLQPTSWNVALDYFGLGIEHILLGLDHLLFVLGLLMLCRGVGLLVKTITAFTLAHSITLGASVMGWIQVPVAPVEAVIALSIVFVALETLRKDRGHSSLTQQAPWLMAFVFGLLHGVGFAAALAEVGLPPLHIPLALLCFNLGVEFGQLAFVATILLLFYLLRRIRMDLPRWSVGLPPYLIGSLAMFWVFERSLNL